MIHLKSKIHDSSSVEFKFWFRFPQSAFTGQHRHNVRKKWRKRNLEKYSIGIWFIVPSGLDINRATYRNEDFYADLKSYYRLITPDYCLDSIAEGIGSPLRHLQSSLQAVSETPDERTFEGFEYQVKMFCSIYRSSLRKSLSEKDSPEQAFASAEKVIDAYSEVKKEIELSAVKMDGRIYCMVYGCYMKGLEYLLAVTDTAVYPTLKQYPSATAAMKLTDSVRKREGFASFVPGNDRQNAEILHRWSMLKKYCSEKLYFGVNTKRDGVLAEQFYYSIAAGMSMVFATVVAFSFQMKYGNFTMPLFIALVVSYMLKDRIKELMRYYFSIRKREKYLDYRTDIMFKGEKVGSAKEGFDFIGRKRIPDFVSECMETPDDQIMLYRSFLRTSPEELREDSEYRIEGINNIVRFNFSRFLKNMDDTRFTTAGFGADGTCSEITADKIYYIRMIIEMGSSAGKSCRTVNICLDNRGIRSIEET